MMKRVLCALLCITVLAGLFVIPAAAEKNPAPEASKAVVGVAWGITLDENGEVKSYKRGTGFGVSPVGKDAQYFVTNCHVVAEKINGRFQPVDHVFILIDGSDMRVESTMVYAEVIYTGANEGLDIAILKTRSPIPGVTTLPLISAENYLQAENVIALGFPGIADAFTDKQTYTTKEMSITKGSATSHRSMGGVKVLDHTANISEGNSGGPLIDKDGQVLGINTWGVESGADARYYAIYADYIMEALDYMNIPYQKGGTSALSPVLIGGIAAVVVLALLAAVWLVVKKTKGAAVTVKCLQGPLAGQSWQLKTTLTIGRDPASTIRFAEDVRGVSRSHCVIQRQGKNVTITDQNSSCGTFVNGQRLAPHQPMNLASGSVISLGSNKILLNITIG